MWWDFSRSWGDTVVANSVLFFSFLKKKQFPKYPGTCWTKQQKRSWRPGMLFMWGLCCWWRRILFREEFPKMTCGTSSCQAPLAHRTLWECMSVVFLKVMSSVGVCNVHQTSFGLFVSVKFLEETRTVPAVPLGAFCSVGARLLPFMEDW